ncbi:MAG: hypothetical protein ACN6NX_07460 [Acinetobacter sp.]
MQKPQQAVAVFFMLLKQISHRAKIANALKFIQFRYKASEKHEWREVNFENDEIPFRAKGIRPLYIRFQLLK